MPLSNSEYRSARRWVWQNHKATLKAWPHLPNETELKTALGVGVDFLTDNWASVVDTDSVKTKVDAQLSSAKGANLTNAEAQVVVKAGLLANYGVI